MTRPYLIAALLGAGALGTLGASSLLPAPAAAQISVFDPTNYSQNLLTAARSLQQINQQIQQLQNEARMLANMDKHLQRIDFPQMQTLQQRLGQIDRLMGQAQGIGFRVADLDKEFGTQFPGRIENLRKRDERLAAAKHRLDAAMAAFRQTMGVQSEIVENVRGDAEALKAIVDKSQGAEGSLAAQQATNQLLALATKQQFQIQQLMAAQFRETTLSSAQRGQDQREARERTRRFLGDGRAYSPPPR